MTGRTRAGYGVQHEAVGRRVTGEALAARVALP